MDNDTIVTIGIAIVSGVGAGLASALVVGISVGKLESKVDKNTTDITGYKEDTHERFRDAETRLKAFDERLNRHEVGDAKTTTLLDELMKRFDKFEEKLDSVGGMIVEFINKYKPGKKD